MRRPAAALGILAAAVVLRLAFHAIYLPAFEGPDEPQHLARALDFARRPLGSALAGREVDADVVAATLTYPCPGRGVGCPPYARVPGAFDLLRPAPPASAAAKEARAIPNEEAKQPPLFYAVAGVAIRGIGTAADPARALLAVRLLGVVFVALALFGPLRRLFRGTPLLAAAGLIALLSPGAAEAFARCSNDAAVLLWSALVLDALDRAAPAAWLVVLLAAGPLLKLTAIPISVFAVVALWIAGRRPLAAACAAASLAVVPVQAARGWLTGGAVELARRSAAATDSVGALVAGLARTAWIMVKMPPWAMGWSALRPPWPIVIGWLALLAAAVLSARTLAPPRRLPAHAGAAAAAVAGTVVFAIALRRYFGVWGGVTGWYVWDWSAWIAVAARDLVVVPRAAARRLLAAEALLVAALNAVWLVQAAAAYGG